MSGIAGLLAWLLEPFDSWTSHQLEVLRSVAVAVGSGLVPVFGLLLTWMLRLIRKDARTARENTSSRDWAGGILVETPVAEMARHAVQKAQQAVDTAKASGEATRQEVVDLSGWVRGSGLHRHPTTDLPRLGELPDD